MDQPVPNVSDDDVARVVRRDFPPADQPAALTLLQHYGTESWHREGPRVRLAILKLAAGNLEKLRATLRTAEADYRDVLAYAEYPRYFTEVNPSSPAAAKAGPPVAVIAPDWEQYRRWLERK